MTVNPDGTFTYTPNADFNGTDSFTYKVTNNGAIETATVSVTVNAVADVLNDSVTVTEDLAQNGNVAANDNFEGPTSYALDTAPTNGSVTVNPDGTFTYTPNADFNGTDSFTYKVTNNGAIETATVSVTVNAVADVLNDAVTVTEDLAQNGNVAANDNFEGPTSYALDTAPTNGSVTVNPDGTFTYTPNADFNGTDSFTYKVTNNGAIETATVSVTVNAVADVLNDAVTVTEDLAQNGNVAANDNFEGPTSYALDTAPTNGSVTVNPDGTFTYTPNADFNGTDSFTYKVTNNGAIETATVSVTVNAIADVLDDALTVTEDLAQNGNVAANDNFEGPTSYALDTAPTNGSVTVNPDGTFTYTPNADFNGTDSFTYKVTNNGAIETATVSVTVNAVADVLNDSVTATEDLAQNGNVSANDNFEGPTTYALDTAPTNGSVTVNPDGTFTYTPNADFNGTDSFTYKVTNNGAIETATVSVTVNAVADVLNDSVTVTEDLAQNGNVAANDNFEGPTSYALDTAPTNGSVTVNPDGTFTYTPNADFNGTDSFTYKVTNNGAIETATVSVTVNAVADVLNDAVTVTEDLAQNGNVAANDNFEGPTSYALDTAPTNGSVTVNPDGTFTYTPNADFNGTDSFTYKVTNNGAIETATVSVTVNAVADVLNDAVTVTEDLAQIGNVAANDNFEGPTIYALDTAPTNGSVTVNPDGTFTYTPNADFNGTDSFTYKVTNNGAIETATVSVTVNAVADVLNDSVTVTEDLAQNGNVAANDNFEGPTTFALDTAPTNGSVTLNPDGTFTYTPNADFNGTDSFTYKVTNNGAIETATVSVTVNAIADVLDDTLTVTEDLAQNGNVAANDNFEGPTTYALDIGPTNGSVTVNPDGTFTYMPNADFNGTDSFTYKVTNNGAIETATVSVTVSAVADAVADNVAATEDTPFNGSVAANDNFEGPTSYALDVAPAHGSVVVNTDGTFTYTPNANYNGPDSFTYKVTNNGADEIAIVNVTIGQVNDPGNFTGNLSATTNEDTSVNGSVVFTDTLDGFAVPNFQVSVPAAHGTATISLGGSWTYSPNLNYNGTDSFTISVTDDDGNVETQVISITINQVNDPGTFTGYTGAGNEDTPITGTLVFSDPADGATNPVTPLRRMPRTVTQVSIRLQVNGPMFLP